MALHHSQHLSRFRAEGLFRRQEFDPSKMCLPDTITSLPGCNKLDVMQARIEQLRQQKVPKEELAEYMCTQEYLDANIG
jgi:hypothetical protein